jgi:hypothetical protein
MLASQRPRNPELLRDSFHKLKQSLRSCDIEPISLQLVHALALIPQQALRPYDSLEEKPLPGNAWRSVWVSDGHG